MHMIHVATAWRYPYTHVLILGGQWLESAIIAGHACRPRQAAIQLAHLQARQVQLVAMRSYHVGDYFVSLLDYMEQLSCFPY